MAFYLCVCFRLYGVALTVALFWMDLRFEILAFSICWFCRFYVGYLLAILMIHFDCCFCVCDCVGCIVCLGYLFLGIL